MIQITSQNFVVIMYAALLMNNIHISILHSLYFFHYTKTDIWPDSFLYVSGVYIIRKIQRNTIETK